MRVHGGDAPPQALDLEVGDAARVLAEELAGGLDGMEDAVHVVARRLPVVVGRKHHDHVLEPQIGETEPPERDPAGAQGASLHVYHLGNSPPHAYVYRAALATPGVAVLHEWSLHHLVLHETVERGDVWAYLREMRRAHGEAGTFVARLAATKAPLTYRMTSPLS